MWIDHCARGVAVALRAPPACRQDRGSGGPDATGEWFTRLTVAWQDIDNSQRAAHALQSSFHPNAAGYAAFAKCLSAFLPTTNAAASCLPGPNGVLNPAPTG